jgi:cytochrome b6-f complex iron-sulfur subunit
MQQDGAHPEPTIPPASETTPPPRRTFFHELTSVAMAGGLVAGYGMFAAVSGRFLYPAKPRAMRWLYVAQAQRIPTGGSLVYRAPSGEAITIARRGDGNRTEDYVALSGTCPHLGCQVHWEAQNNRFFCPCHNGVFTPEGKATSGPPADAGQSLFRFPLKVENDLLFIEVSTDKLAALQGGELQAPGGPPGPGHDPCLYASNRQPREC